MVLLLIMYYLWTDTRSYSNYVKYILVILYSISTYLPTDSHSPFFKFSRLAQDGKNSLGGRFHYIKSSSALLQSSPGRDQ